MYSVDIENVCQLYRKYATSLDAARDEQRALLHSTSGMKTQLDDLEAEITYLLIRHARPDAVVEIGTLHGWSTSWILRALRDNEHGFLRSYDISGRVTGNIPRALSADRWEFIRGDVRTTLTRIPDGTEYLFIDAAHSARFARWYLGTLFPVLRPGIPVSVHDVFHRRRPLPCTEGAVVTRWLARRGLPYFTASAAHAPRAHARLHELRGELELDEPVRTGEANPMLFCTL